MEVTAVATMTLARTDHEATLLGTTLERLSRLGLPIFAADGGSNELFTAHARQIPHLELWLEGATRPNR